MTNQEKISAGVLFIFSPEMTFPCTFSWLFPHLSGLSTNRSPLLRSLAWLTYSQKSPHPHLYTTVCLFFLITLITTSHCSICIGLYCYLSASPTRIWALLWDKFRLCNFIGVTLASRIVSGTLRPIYQYLLTKSKLSYNDTNCEQ